MYQLKDLFALFSSDLICIAASPHAGAPAFFPWSSKQAEDEDNFKKWSRINYSGVSGPRRLKQKWFRVQSFKMAASSQAKPCWHLLLLSLHHFSTPKAEGRQWLPGLCHVKAAFCRPLCPSVGAQKRGSQRSAQPEKTHVKIRCGFCSLSGLHPFPWCSTAVWPGAFSLMWPWKHIFGWLQIQKEHHHCFYQVIGQMEFWISFFFLYD